MTQKKLSKQQYNLLIALESLFPEKQGGGLLSTLASFIPGAGNFIAPGIDLLSGLFSNQEEEVVVPKPNLNNNIYGNIMKSGGKIGCKDCGGSLVEAMKKGGWIQKAVNPEHKGYCTPMSKATCTPRRKALARTFKKMAKNREDGGELDEQVLNQGFKQYNAGSHASGRDVNVNQNGNISNAPVASVQNKENAYSINEVPYVMSDTLVNPETGKTFNVDAALINKSFPKASKSIEDKNTMDFKMNRLSRLNDIMRNMKEQYQMAIGGKLKKYQNGSPILPDPYTGKYYSTEYDAYDLTRGEDPSNFDPISQADQYPYFLDRSQQVPTIPQDIRNIEGYVPTSDNTNYQETKQRDLPIGDIVSGDTKKPFNFNSIAIGLKGLGLAKSFADAITKPEVETPILTDYQKSDKYMKEANVDFTQAKQNAIGASNIGANVNRSASGNFSQYQNREAARVANLSDAIANIDMQENNARSQLNLRRAGYEQGKALDVANTLRQNRVANQMNQATANLADQKLFTEISQIGTEFNKYQNFREQLANNKELQQYYINEALALINSRNTNFQLDSDFVNKLKSGAASIDDIIKVVNMTGLKIGNQ